LLQRTGRTELAIQTFAFALQHSAINQETTEHLQKLLNSSTQVLPGALFTSLIEQGRAFTVEELVLYLHSELVACADEVEVTRNSPKAVPTHPKTSIPEQLSERELEVLNYLAEGLSNEEIAERLIITVGTVKAHNHHIFSKLWVKNRSQAVYRARELELLPLPR
jgi:ATP/maltotriose-dependent transcriptional regulator MalT